MMEVASLDDKYFASTMVYNQRFYLANVDVWNSLGGFWLCISNKKKKAKIPTPGPTLDLAPSDFVAPTSHRRIWQSTGVDIVMRKSYSPPKRRLWTFFPWELSFLHLPISYVLSWPSSSFSSDRSNPPPHICYNDNGASIFAGGQSSSLELMQHIRRRNHSS